MAPLWSVSGLFQIPSRKFARNSNSVSLRTHRHFLPAVSRRPTPCRYCFGRLLESSRTIANCKEKKKTERDQGEKKTRHGMHTIISASCLPRGIQISTGKFSSGGVNGVYPSNACPPVLSLILSILYFPSSPSTTTHVTLANVRRLHLLSFVKNRGLMIIDIPLQQLQHQLTGKRILLGKMG